MENFLAHQLNVSYEDTLKLLLLTIDNVYNLDLDLPTSFICIHNPKLIYSYHVLIEKPIGNDFFLVRCQINE